MGPERYTHGYSDAVVSIMESRSPEKVAGFLMPYLKPGMSLLDCGCGPGSTTIGFARLLAPGKVAGIDIGAGQIERARANASKAKVANVSFKIGSAYDLPYPDGSFDAAFAHTVLQHLKEPERVLQEILRVLKPGGVFGVRDEDNGTWITYPDSPALAESHELYMRVWWHNGGDPDLGRRHRSLLTEAGFARVEAGATAVVWSTPESARWWAEINAGLVLDPHYVDTVTRLGWGDREMLSKHSRAWLEWGRRPDAFSSWTWCHAVGWKA